MTHQHDPKGGKKEEEEVQAPKEVKVSKKPMSSRKKGIIAAIVAVGLFILMTVMVYTGSITSGFTRVVTSVIPYPAFSVDGKTVSIAEYLSEYNALVQFFGMNEEGASALPEDQIEAAIAQALINKIAIQQLAEQYGVELDEERVETYYQSVLAGQESEEAFKEELELSFGWTIEMFKDRIVSSIVRSLQISEVILGDDEVQAEREALAQEALERVSGGELFAVVAKDVHSGFDGLSSDLGYVKTSMMPDAWREAVIDLEPGEVTDVIDLPEGYAVFRLEDRTEEGDEAQLHINVISVPKITLEQVIEEYLEGVTVKNYIGELNS